MDLTRITVFCFSASYVVAFALEAFSAWRRFGVHRPVLLGFAAAGVFAHATYLALRATGDPAPLSSPADWCLVAALVLAGVYAAGAFTSPRLAIGLFLLPAVLGLILASRMASTDPLSSQRSSYLWGVLHSGSLILATTTVTLGFLAGVMYLIQSWRLKQKLPAAEGGFRLPTLERLEAVNSRSLGFSVWLTALGFVSGLVLTRMSQAPGGATGHGLWTDPAVISLSAMLGWLVLVELFRLLYPAARRGRKVAYLTTGSFVFLVITLVALVSAPADSPTDETSLRHAPRADAAGLASRELPIPHSKLLAPGSPLRSA